MVVVAEVLVTPYKVTLHEVPEGSPDSVNVTGYVVATVKGAEAEFPGASRTVTVWVPAGIDGTGKVHEKLPRESVVRLPTAQVEIVAVPKDNVTGEVEAKPPPLAVTEDAGGPEIGERDSEVRWKVAGAELPEASVAVMV